MEILIFTVYYSLITCIIRIWSLSWLLGTHLPRVNSIIKTNSYFGIHMPIHPLQALLKIFQGFFVLHGIKIPALIEIYYET